MTEKANSLSKRLDDLEKLMNRRYAHLIFLEANMVRHGLISDFDDQPRIEKALEDGHVAFMESMVGNMQEVESVIRDLIQAEAYGGDILNVNPCADSLAALLKLLVKKGYFTKEEVQKDFKEFLK